ncbi:MAG: ADP-dependent NAD(P)H-hydrate dehydratase / NAD(P)H-hydrate epimerase, partial [Chloroflexota bacterium]|nr:ADP-dependent NAD(P)H-hydrate dehydratase / NAD(P)H-hydrate epimerase [Chloroflexota bacterium]
MKLGIDVVPVARISAAVERFGERFLKRIYTQAELDYVKGDHEKLAGRWAAKEAVLKALGGRGRFPRMSLVEVLPGRRGAPEVRLTREPTPDIAVSITHDGGVAMAIAAIADPEPEILPPGERPPELRLPERPDSGHKGTFGQVVVVAGSLGYTGAAFLSATAAARAGAGYVRLLAAETLYPILAIKCTEVVVTQVPEVGQGVLGHAGLEPIQRYCWAGDAAIIGPGLGREYSTRRMVLDLVTQLRSPAVIDADALNALASQPRQFTRMRRRLVLTPHPAEMARLTGLSVEQVEEDRAGVAQRFAREWGQVVVLKGAETVIADPNLAVELGQRIEAAPHLELEGLFTHMAEAGVGVQQGRGGVGGVDDR